MSNADQKLFATIEQVAKSLSRNLQGQARKRKSEEFVVGHVNFEPAAVTMDKIDHMQNTIMNTFEEQLNGLSTTIDARIKNGFSVMATSRPQASTLCFYCGNDGHWAKDCPNKPTAPKCAICDREGHTDVSCPVLKRAKQEVHSETHQPPIHAPGMFEHPDRRQHTSSVNQQANLGHAGHTGHSGHAGHPGHAVHVADGKRYSGKGTRFNTRKGFGFIIPDHGGDDIFCHAADIKDGDSFREGATLSYEIGHSAPKKQNLVKPKAVNVTGGHCTTLMLDGPAPPLLLKTDPTSATAFAKNEHAIGSGGANRRKQR
jgi:cold shock CspA family protein